MKQNIQLNTVVKKRSFFNFKYKWALRKYWIAWFNMDVRKWYYSIIHGFKMNSLNGTMLPSTGKGKFVSVYLKGEIIQIKHENGYDNLEYDEIRIIPSQENHGVYIERLKKDKMCDRHMLDLGQFNKKYFFASNVEQLTDN